MAFAMVIAGGTGGHIFPALAVADELTRKGYEVFWLGARYGLETKLVPDSYPMELISVKGIRKRGLAAKLLAPWQILRATWKAYQIINLYKPKVVLAMGGYVSVPGVLAATIKRLPVVIHEQNAKVGLANRWLAKVARVRLQAFSDAFAPEVKAKTVGNPVRDSILKIEPPVVRFATRTGPLRVLVVGGSQGAAALNQCLVSVWRSYPDLSEIEVWHQTGEQDFISVQKSYSELAVKSKVAAFIDDISAAYSWADLVICRAGAMTVSELTAVGVASILIPYPHAVDDHQYYNARYISTQAAGILLDQGKMSPEVMAKWIDKFAHDRPCLLNMAQSARNLAYLDAAEKVASECINCT